MKQYRWVAWMCGTALAAAGAGLAGCDDDDDGESPGTTMVVVVTNAAGTVVTNIVEAPVPAPAADNAEAAILDVAGRWNGIIENTQSEEWANIDLFLDQDGAAITGEADLEQGGQHAIGPVTGSLAGRHLVLELTPDTDKGAKLIAVERPTTDMDGQLNADATEYEGTWTSGPSRGTFALQKSRVN